MTRKYVKVLYSTIKAHGPMHMVDAAFLIKAVDDLHLAVAKSRLREATCDRFPDTVLKINSEGRVDILRDATDVEGNEHLSYEDLIKVFLEKSL